MPQALKRFAVDRGGALALVAFVFYAALATSHVVDGDNAEYSTLGTLGGVAHPTGYPLYLMWLRITAWLPGSAAHAASLATAVIAAACVLVVHAACRAWGARPLAATIAAGLFAASPLVVRLATQAEVFALNDLIAALILWLVAARGPVRGTWRALALGLVAGAGMSNHLTCVLLAPLGILGIVRAAREASPGRAVGCALGGLVVGLVPYAYLVATAENPLSWGQHVDGVHAVVHHFLREDYGGPGAFAPDPIDVPVLDNLGAFAHVLGRTWVWLPIAACALVVRRRDDDEPRWGWAMLALAFVLVGPLLVARFDVTHEGPGLYVIQRFFVLPTLLLAPPIAVGLDRVLRGRLAGGFGAGLAVVIVATAAALSVPYVQAAHSPAVELGVRNMLRPLPPDAVVIVYEDDRHFGSGYVQLVLGERRDVMVVLSTAVGLPVERERIAARLGIALPADAKLLGVPFAQDVLARGRPVFVDDRAIDILAALPSYPYGSLYRVLPRGQAPPPIEDVFALDKQIYASFELGYPLPHAGDDWPTHVHIRYVTIWQRIGDELRAHGRTEDAGFAYELGRELAPLP